MSQSKFIITKMDCPTEEQIIRNRLKSVEGIENISFNLVKRELTVNHSLEGDNSILDALKSVGMEPSTEALTTSKGKNQRLISNSAWVLMGLSGILAISAELFELSTSSKSSLPVIGTALLSILIGGKDTLRKGWAALRTFTLNINFLMTVAIIGAVCIGQWPEAAMVTFLFGVAEMIEALSLDRARNAIRALMDMNPETATVKNTAGEWKEVDAGSVKLGDLVRVKPGERIPLDGKVTEGQSSINQAPITGESIPVEKKIGDSVFAGTINERGTFIFEVTGARGQTTLDKIIHSVEEAQSQQAPTQRFVDNFARYYTPIVVVLAILVACLPPLLLSQPFVVWLYRALVLLVIACPCALVISTPVTVVSGLAASAKRGILIKGGIYLENGRKLRVLALDKTGTITVGKPMVTDIVPLNSATPEALLQIAASLDTLSEHPVASAIVASNKDGKILQVTNFEAIVGRGVKGEIEGTLYFIGNHRLTEENKVCGSHVEDVLFRFEKEGKTAVVLTTETEALAVIAVADTVRETSIEAIKEIQALGIRTIMLTGDNSTTAKAIASKVGIDDAQGDLLPEAKLATIVELQNKYGITGMVGDGVNDAPALAKADIGFAMGAAGTDTALETADVALMQDDLRKLSEFVRLSHRTGSILIQNISFAIGIIG